MSDSTQPANDARATSASDPEIPSFEELAADPEIAPLLDFEPVPRQIVKADGWTPAMQRMFIAWLAWYGSPTSACDELGKARSGIDKLYKAADGDEFRAAWDGAVALHEQRRIERMTSRHAGNGALRPPTLSRGRPEARRPDHDEQADDGWDVSEEEKLQLVEHIAGRFMKKVAAERQARLNGEIVAADFHLRQITMIEVLFDLTASEFGWDPSDLLRGLRRGGHTPVEIVSTPFSDWLDSARREWWLSEGEPDRPRHPDPRFLKRYDEGPWGSRGSEGYSLNLDQHTTGATTPPARGCGPDGWRQMNAEQQRAARQKQFDEDAAEQRAWELRAIAEHKRSFPEER